MAAALDPVNATADGILLPVDIQRERFIGDDRHLPAVVQDVGRGFPEGQVFGRCRSPDFKN